MRSFWMASAFVALATAGSLSPATADDAAATVPTIAAEILDDSKSNADREALIAAHKDKSAALIAKMAEGLGSDSKEEYRRIPWIWRVAIAAGKRNDAAEMVQILEVSLPKPSQPLADWQSVVVGGGIINGLTHAGEWPEKRVAAILKNNPALAARWKQSLEQAATMADNEATPNGSRYDALRMIAMEGWNKRGEQLAKYLKKGTHAELQMGAVSGTADVPDPAATTALIQSLAGLEPENRELALDGLLRSDDRMLALLAAVREKSIDVALVDDARRTKLREAKSEQVRHAAAEAFGK
jgi:hypothetical protein